MKAGWREQIIKDACRLVNGGTPKSKVSDYWNGDIQWLTPADMGKMTSEYVETTPRTITKLGLESSSAKLVPAYSVIMSCRAPIGHLAINTVEMAFNQGCKALIPNAGTNVRFLYYFLMSHRHALNELGTGTTFKELSGKTLNGFPIPLPPLEEQQAIVDKLDRAFAGLETARANAEANLENAKELFQSALTKSLDNKTSQVPLADLADANYGYTASAAHNIDGVKFLRITDIQNGTVTWQQVPSCSISAEDKEKYRLIPNDIVFARTGATTGKSYLITDEIDAVAASYLIRLRVKDDRVRPRFLYAFFQSSAYWREVRKGIEGAAQGGFNASKLGKLLIPLVSLEEQEMISAMMSRLQNETDRLQEEYTRQLSDLDELKQSLLQKAFAGELT